MFGKSFRYATVFSVDQPSILPVPRAAVQKQHRAGACFGVRWRRAVFVDVARERLWTLQANRFRFHTIKPIASMLLSAFSRLFRRHRSTSQKPCSISKSLRTSGRRTIFDIYAHFSDALQCRSTPCLISIIKHFKRHLKKPFQTNPHLAICSTLHPKISSRK
jgi:hypothetical protein